MALAQILGLGNFNSAGMGLASIKFDAEPADGELLAFQKELGITLQDKRSEATVKAFQNPQEALKNYQDERKKIDADALLVFKRTGKQIEDSGLPKDFAIQYARTRAKEYFDKELEVLNLTHPYAETAESLISLASGAKRRDLIGRQGGAAAPVPVPAPVGGDR